MKASVYITRLTLRNWRNFQRFDLALSERTFVIGPNASGKSNLLDVFRFLRDIAKPGGGLQRAVNERGGLSKVRCLAARKDPDVSIDVEISVELGRPKWRYAIEIAQQPRGDRLPIVKSEKVWLDGQLLTIRPDSADEVDDQRLTQTHLEQINSNGGFREVVKFFESIRYLHLIPQLLRHPEAFQATGGGDDAFGRNFLELIVKSPEKTRRRRLRKIEAVLKAAVPQLSNLTDSRDELGIPHLEATYTHWRPNAGLQREDQFSDGTLRLVGLLWSLLDGDSLLLLEEPELSLHREIVRKLPGMFSRIQTKHKRQIIVSTHSEDLLSDRGIGGEETVMLEPGREGTIAKLASDDKEARGLLEAGASVGEAALSRTTPADIAQMPLFE